MAASSKEIRRAVKGVRASVRGRVHKSVLVRVNNICLLIEQILPRADDLGAGSEEMYTLSKMATDYLPGALKPYLALPRNYAERSPQADGRTPILILCAQLDVMYAQMTQIADSALRVDGDRLIASERFLEDKFGRNPLTVPPSHQAPKEKEKDGRPLAEQLVYAAAQRLLDRMRDRK